MTNFSVGQLEWIRAVFTLLLVGACAAVSTGLYWERKNFPRHMQQRSWRILLVGLASGTLAALFLLLVNVTLLRHQAVDPHVLNGAAANATAAADIASHAAMSLRDAQRMDQTTQETLKDAAQDQQKVLDVAGAEMVGLQSHGAGIETRQPQRHLTKSQIRALVSALARFAGQKVSITSLWGDADANIFKQDFVSVLKAARWGFDANRDVRQSIIPPPPPIGVQVTMNQGDSEAGPPPEAVAAFVAALHELGITPDNTVFVNAAVPPGAVVLLIGARPSP